VASAFISYAHEDQEFMLALAEPLKDQGLDIYYDQVVLNIGDSLIRKISEQIADGDFLIAIVSPDSAKSEWCQKELSLAATQGINQKRVKVLPVRVRGAAMPPMFEDTFWGDGDRDDAETLARRLAAAIRANLEGREAEADRAAEEVEEAPGAPAHAEVAGDVGVAQIETVAAIAWEVFDAWMGVWNRGGNIHDADDPRRRLRWALEALPDRVRAAIPLVEQLANAPLEEFFTEADDVAEPERAIREELTAVRTRVAQGLPVVGRWLVVEDLGQVNAGRRDATAYGWRIQRGEETRVIEVFISGTLMACALEGLDADVAAARTTRGRSVLGTLVGLDDPPSQISVTTAGISDRLPD
jgi:hypothetical protein